VVTRRGFCHLAIGGAAMTLAPARSWASAASADGFSRALPEARGVSSRSILAFLDEVRAADVELHSFMLYRHGSVIAEGWWDPYRADRKHMMHSVTKSVTVCAVGLAMAEGRFGLADKVVSFFPEELPSQIDPKLAAMTVEDLLTMRTGHAAEVSGSVWRPIKTSWVAEFFRIPVVDQPGTKFLYTSAATYMLSAIISKTTGLPTRDYLQPRLFMPLAIEDYDWPLDPHGISPGANGFSCRTADLLKLGVLYLHNGEWHGKQVLPREWVAQVQAPHVKDKYGYQWWLAPGSYSARGLFGQFSIVYPKDDAVLAITAAIPSGSNFLGRFVFKHFPAEFAASALPADAATDRELAARTRSLTLLPPVKPTTSPIAAKVSGRPFAIDANEDQVQSVRFDFARGRCRFTLTDDRGTHTVDAGLDKRIEGNTSMTGGKLHHEYELDSMRVVASGEWRDPQTFVMTWIFVESVFRDTVVCRFDGDKVTIDRSVNVNSGPLARPTLVGR
jgi:CubicO group peptidase (beta-lactamase class C family)